VLGMGTVTLVAASSVSGGDAQPLAANLLYNLDRIFGVQDLRAEGENFLANVTEVASKVSLPLVLLLVAATVGRVQVSKEPLLLLSFALSMAVAAFNVVVFRMPGAGTYYMTQAAIPLAYIAARSIVAICGTEKLVVAGAAIGLNALASLPIGLDALPRFDAGLSGITTGITKADQTRLVANALAPLLGAEDIVLLDGWQFQSRALPYWLGRWSNYGYLLDMEPDAAAKLLAGTGTNRIAAVAFLGDGAEEILRGDKWLSVAMTVKTSFVELNVPEAPDWRVMIRKPAADQ
jgi:hypothetical protein